MCSQASYFLNLVLCRVRCCLGVWRGGFEELPDGDGGGHCFAETVPWMRLPRLEAPKMLTHGWGGPEGNWIWWMPVALSRPPFPLVWLWAQWCFKRLFGYWNFRDSSRCFTRLSYVMSVGHESGPWVDFISFYFFPVTFTKNCPYWHCRYSCRYWHRYRCTYGEGIKSRTSTIPERLCTAELQPSPTMVIF